MLQSLELQINVSTFYSKMYIQLKYNDMCMGHTSLIIEHIQCNIINITFCTLHYIIQEQYKCWFSVFYIKDVIMHLTTAVAQWYRICPMTGRLWVQCPTVPHQKCLKKMVPDASLLSAQHIRNKNKMDSIWNEQSREISICCDNLLRIWP